MAERLPEVFLVRHGETEWSRAGKHTGRTDPPLTEVGRGRAEGLRPTLGRRPFARVLTSPLSRAADTCKLAGLDDGAETRDDLLEWDYGEYEGLTTSEIHERRPDWSLWRDGCPGGEQAGDVGARTDRVIAELRGLEGDAAVFAHGHVLRVLAARWIELPPQEGARLMLSTATVSVLSWEHGTRAIRIWNSAPSTADT